jgi:hypothetical protein
MNLSPDSFVVELRGDVETLGLGQRKAGAKLPICILVRPELKFQPGCFPHAGSILLMQLLQCCSSKIDSAIVKNEVYIYIYYIYNIYKYRSIFLVLEKPLENCNTATRSKASAKPSLLGLCRAPARVDVSQRAAKFSAGRKKSKKVGQKFVDRNERFVPLPHR